MKSSYASWAVLHDAGRKFDPEDRRLLENASNFAASSFRILGETEPWRDLLEKLARTEPIRSPPLGGFYVSVISALASRQQSSTEDQCGFKSS